jgi:Fe-coproporphyrin III synthase
MDQAPDGSRARIVSIDRFRIMTLLPTTVARNALVQLSIATGRVTTLPLLIFFPTARCNSRCVSCDWWKADGASDLTMQEIQALAAQLPALGVRVVLFSGGEPLLRRDVYEIARVFRAQGPKLHLLTSGLFLERDADRVAQLFENVTISLDGPTRESYVRIRGVDAFGVVERGVRKLKSISPQKPVRGRSTLHRHNFRLLPDIVDKARELGLDQISFLAADVTSEAFGRMTMRTEDSTRGLLLNEEEAEEFGKIVERTIQSHQRDFTTRFIAESPDKLRRLPLYYAAHLGGGRFPPISCNAPWVSIVIEADGTVRPCYFHRPVGNVRDKPLKVILEHEMQEFREGLDVSKNPVCSKCVCTMKVRMRTKLW